MNPRQLARGIFSTGKVEKLSERFVTMANWVYAGKDLRPKGREEYTGVEND